MRGVLGDPLALPDTLWFAFGLSATLSFRPPVGRRGTDRAVSRFFGRPSLPLYASRSATLRFKAQVAVQDVAQLFEEACALETLEGVTFSGGEPMQQAEALLNLMDEIRQMGPSVSFGMFTGYTETELAMGQYLTYPRATPKHRRDLWRGVQRLLDFAIMGRYDATQPGTEPLRTSRNQKLVLFSDRYQAGDFGPQLVEINIGSTGKTVLTGFPVLGIPA